jgi:hypothetical protein
MKTLLSLAFVITALIFLNSCSQNGPETEQERIEKILSSGDWRITRLFYDSNQLDHYSPAFLSFQANRIVKLSHAGALSEGEWHVRNSIQNFHHLQLSFTDTTLNAIAGDWKIVDYTKTDFVMEDAANSNIDLGAIKKASITRIFQ